MGIGFSFVYVPNIYKSSVVVDAIANTNLTGKYSLQFYYIHSLYTSNSRKHVLLGTYLSYTL